MDILKNVVSENRVEKIRLIDPEHYVVGGQPVGDWDTPNDNNAHYDLACTAKFLIDEVMNLKTDDIALKKYMRELVYLVCPVGTRRTSTFMQPSSKHWVTATGEWFRRIDYPELWDYYLTANRPIVNDMMQIIDERGTVARAQNKGRFAGIEEIDLGKYQADATQRETGNIGAVQFGISGFGVNGLYTIVDTGYKGIYETKATNTHNGVFTITSDNARVVRTSTEERVKATGVYVQIFVGLGDF